jgi:hypothetical protein
MKTPVTTLAKSMTIPLAKAEELLAGIEAARLAFHQPDSPAKTQAFLGLAWQSGVLAYHVKEAQKAT